MMIFLALFFLKLVCSMLCPLGLALLLNIIIINNILLLPQKCNNLLPVTRGCVFSGVFLSLAASGEETFGISNRALSNDIY